MAESPVNQFRPDYAIPPGFTLIEVLNTLGMTQAQLADRTGRLRKTINEIVKGKSQITPDTAIQLERALGVPAAFWNNLERQYRETMARLDEARRLENQLEWMESFPLRDMAKLGWISLHRSPVRQLQELLNYFGVATPEAWRELWQGMPVAFRRSPAFEADPGAVAAWLRQGEIQAQQVQCSPFDEGRFREALDSIRAKTTEPPEAFVPAVRDIAATAGVVILFIRELPKIRASGATRWLTPTKALVQLSLRYKTDDHLWFTFFHESGHILLHGKTEVFIEDPAVTSEKENEANEFAASYLIPRQSLEAFALAGRKSKVAIREFAEELGVSPGIVVGQLQHIGFLPHSHCNELKRHFEWTQ